MSSILNLIKSIQEITNVAPCKKTVQKMIYLIQEANEDYGFDYSIHYYGPYSAELDSEIRYLCTCGELNMDISSHGHMLSVSTSFTNQPLNQVTQNTITSFAMKSPSELELLATTLYVQREIHKTDIDNIVNSVTKIKGTKYSEAQIKEAIFELVKNGYFMVA